MLRENTLTRFPAGSLKIIERFPQGWVAGSMTHATPSAAMRSYSASTSSAMKSRIDSRTEVSSLAGGACSSSDDSRSCGSGSSACANVSSDAWN